MLIADRFLSLDGRTIDLASGRRVLLRTTAGSDVGEQLAWADSCAAGGHLARVAAQGQAGAGVRPETVLLDYGLLPDGNRFEVFGEGAKPGLRRSRIAPRPRLGSEAPGAEPDAAMVESSLRQALDAFEAASFGAPRVLRLPVQWQRRSPAILDIIARAARLNGFVPVSMDLLLNLHRAVPGLRASLAEIVETRHVLLILHGHVNCDHRGSCAPRGGIVSPCPVAVGRLVLGVGLKSARPHVLLFASDPWGPTGFRRACDCVHGGAAAGGDTGAPPDPVARPRIVRRRSHIAAEARETYRLTVIPDLVRARTRAAEAVAQARSGGSARTERALREAMGVLARRDDVAGAGWVALNLGCLLLDRGRALDAARTFDASRAHFDRAKDLAGAIRAAVYVGLAWTDDSRLTQAEAAFRSARIAAQAAGLGDLQVDADIALARCLYWQGRFDEATVLAASLGDRPDLSCENSGPAGCDDRPYPRDVPDRPLAVVREAQPAETWGGEAPGTWPYRLTLGITEGDRQVRLAALSARIALACGDVRAASAHATGALDTARRQGKPVDVCAARTALAAVAAALKDLDGMLEHVRGGLAAAHQAHAPLRAIRLRLIACDTLRHAGREREAARVLNRLAGLDASRFPALLRARLQVVLDNGRQPAIRGASRPVGSAAAADARAARLLVAACPWRLPARPADINDDIVGVLQACHEIEDEETSLVRVCEALRERACAVAIAVVGRSGAAAAVLAHAGSGGRSTLADRALDTGVAVSVAATPLGLEAASPVRYAGGVIGAVVGRWTSDSLIDPARVACLLSAAGAAVAPQVRSVLDRREASPAGIGRDAAELVGVSEAVQALRKAASRAATAPFPVLIEGESGSGKELVARAIHRESPRRARRFCALNCAALNEELLEAELFGHARGAFTGAVSERVGLFEEADGGTLFLDEVADLSARAQAKLLRVLQDGEVRRVGENFARHVDARVIAATNRQLQQEAVRGAFRRDLFYRLNVVHIDVPPLRDRPEDIAVLAAHFWARSIARIGSRATLAPATIAALARYDWPGNVRELQNVMAALAVSAPRRGSVRPACLPGAIARADIGASTLDEARRSFERRFVRAALARAGGQRSRAALSLGISRQGLAKLIARLGLTEGADSDSGRAD